MGMIKRAPAGNRRMQFSLSAADLDRLERLRRQAVVSSRALALRRALAAVAADVAAGRVDWTAARRLLGPRGPRGAHPERVVRVMWSQWLGDDDRARLDALVSACGLETRTQALRYVLRVALREENRADVLNPRQVK